MGYKTFYCEQFNLQNSMRTTVDNLYTDGVD